MINHKQQQTSLSSQTGFTIIESLVAILVAGILLAAIAPVIVLSVGTRLQARRVELATDTAKTYLDGIRTGTIPAPPSTGTDAITLDQYPAPKANTLTCSPNSYCSQPSADLYCMSSCSTTKDFVVQAFRYSIASNDVTNGYSLGIRVYRVDAFKDNDNTNLGKGAKQATFIGEVGGLKYRKSPVVEITTEVSNSSTTLDSLCKRLNNASNQTTNPHCS